MESSEIFALRTAITHVAPLGSIRGVTHAGPWLGVRVNAD